jgi:predicted DNA-binding transcriptional regulator YafY
VRSRLKHVLARQWTLIQELGRHHRGCTVSGLAEALGAHRATVYRDLDELRTCGVPIDSRNVNGEARYVLAGTSLPPLTATATQLAALRLARRMLAHLDGTQITAELDALLKLYAALVSDPPTVSTRRAPALAPELVAELDRAIRQARRVRIRVRTRKEKRPTWRLLDPLSLRHHKGTLSIEASADRSPAACAARVSALCANVA